MTNKLWMVVTLLSLLIAAISLVISLRILSLTLVSESHLNNINSALNVWEVIE